ncbi:hypothetical protein Bbelb_004130 [Branchiostoma belcheri]|nr:hypothetical protein Bbelb_004130 [Branchiostoma belcheri]
MPRLCENRFLLYYEHNFDYTWTQLVEPRRVVRARVWLHLDTAGGAKTCGASTRLATLGHSWWSQDVWCEHASGYTWTQLVEPRRVVRARVWLHLDTAGGAKTCGASTRLATLDTAGGAKTCDASTRLATLGHSWWSQDVWCEHASGYTWTQLVEPRRVVRARVWLHLDTAGGAKTCGASTRLATLGHSWWSQDVWCEHASGYTWTQLVEPRRVVRARVWLHLDTAGGAKTCGASTRLATLGHSWWSQDVWCEHASGYTWTQLVEPRRVVRARVWLHLDTAGGAKTCGASTRLATLGHSWWCQDLFEYL